MKNPFAKDHSIGAVASPIVLACAVFLGACTPAGTGTTGPSPLAVTPRCTILATTVADKPNANTRASFDGIVLVSERTDPNTDHGFTPFRSLAEPRGNSSIGSTPDVYGISEAWLRNPFSAEVFRAQVHPAPRPASSDSKGNAWSVQSQDATGNWSPVIGTFSAFNRNDERDPAVAGSTVPQLMPVGRSNPQMFACGGERSMDGQIWTTWLMELTTPNAALGRRGGVAFIQDVLNGDERFVPNARGVGGLIGPATPPTPTIHGPGNPIRDGWVQCAMTQLDDDLATRELHVLTVSGGRLYHSKASSFGPATTGAGTTINRFSAITPWADVGQALGGGFPDIVSAALVAPSHSTAISVFFVDQSGGRFRLWHTVRFASGAWRPAENVFALSGEAANGTDRLRVAAGACPAPGASDWTAQNTELLVALLGGPTQGEVSVIRVVPTPRQWKPGVSGIYSPRERLAPKLGAGSGVDPARNPNVLNLVVTARPFRDTPP